MKEIPLTQGKVALVDDEDFNYLNQFKWHYHHSKHGHGYGARGVNKNKQRKVFLMHRVIMGVNQEMYIDHKNNNGLDNQKSNLRICTQSQNCMNKVQKKSTLTSKFKGVSVHTNTNPNPNRYYIARIKVNKKRIHKLFPPTKEGEIQAAIWYNEMAKKHFGEFAVINVI